MGVLYLTLFIVLLDQGTKLAVKGFALPFLDYRYIGMYHGQSIPILGEFFQLTFVENPGMAFGIDVNSTAKPWISLFSVVASIGLFYYLYLMRNQSKSMRISLAFILGGAIGNLIDRVFYGVFYGYAPILYGKVVDFFNFDFFDVTLFGQIYTRFPIFNIADAAVSIGVFILLIFYKQHQEELQPPVAEAAGEGAQDSGIPADSENIPSPENGLVDEEKASLHKRTAVSSRGNADREGSGIIDIPYNEPEKKLKITKPEHGQSDNRENIQI